MLPLLLGARHHRHDVSAVESVQDDLDTLRTTASDAVADDVSTLQQSIDDLVSALSALGGDLTSDNLASVGDAVGAVGAAAQAVFATLGNC